MSTPDRRDSAISRRELLGSAAAMASMSMLGSVNTLGSETPKPAAPKRKIKLGWIGCGGRGNWLVPLFLQHGGYEIHAVADYFPQVAEEAGNKFGVVKIAPVQRAFGLQEAHRQRCRGRRSSRTCPTSIPSRPRPRSRPACTSTWPSRSPSTCRAAWPSGRPPKQATQKKRCFLVDYQLPHDPACIEVATRVREGGLGKLAHVASFGIGWHAWPDPPLGKNIESRLRDEIWLSDTALSGDTIVSYDIHIIDGLVWTLGQRPASACGRSRTCRPDPHGDRTDAAAVIYELPDGTIWTHVTQSIDNNFDITTLSASIFGMQATAHMVYGGKSYVRGGPKHYSGTSGDIYKDGAVKNIAAFHKNIVEGHFENLSAQRAVDGTLTAILGREAAARRGFLTMDDADQGKQAAGSQSGRHGGLTERNGTP